MTDKTATQNLTRTTASDDPKLMATYLKALAVEVDDRMRAHYYDLGRSQEPPFAVVRHTTVETFDWTLSDPISWDTVEVDTAGLVDLSVSAFVINLRQTGWWAIGGYSQTSGFGVAAADTGLSIAAAGSTASNVTRDGAIGLAGLSVSAIVEVLTPDTEHAALFLGNTGGSLGNTTTLSYAEMWAYKVRDL